MEKVKLVKKLPNVPFMRNEHFCSLDSVASCVDENVIFLAIRSSQFTDNTCGNRYYNLLTRRCIATLFYLKQTSFLVFVLSLSLRLHLLFLAARSSTFLLQFKKP